MAKTVIVDIEHSRFPEVSIPVDTYVVWHNRDSVVHSAEMSRESEPYFDAGALHPGEASSPIYFGSPGSYDYACRYHHDMRGRITVMEDGEPTIRPGEGHHSHHMTHYHGFVTGGRSGTGLFMSHTPVMADERHRFQVILRGSLIEPEQIGAYEEGRKQDFGTFRWQVFHSHQDMERIGRGEISELNEALITYSSDGVTETPVPGLPEYGTRVRIDKVIHFHAFEADDKYPARGLEYILYGDSEEVFADHHISRAPNFHSVAKLAHAPSFWTGEGPVTVTIPSKRIKDVSPKQLSRMAFVDNAFHLAWLPPSGLLRPADPLRRRDGSLPVYDVVLEDGSAGQIEIEDFLHFDVRLLNYGVFLPDEQ
jgi:hypothetical protein